jgi:hypothetical protein
MNTSQQIHLWKLSIEKKLFIYEYEAD